jgi:hypothetical protein
MIVERDYRELLPKLIDGLFDNLEERNRAIELLQSYQHNEEERVRVGILRASRGRFSEIVRLLRLANTDWRDLLVEAEYPLSFGREKLRKDDPEKYRSLKEKEAREYDDWLNQVLA